MFHIPWFLGLIGFLGLCTRTLSVSVLDTHKPPPIVYLFIALNRTCEEVSATTYINATLHQALQSQGPKASIVFAANFNDCKPLKDIADGLSGITQFDILSKDIMSNRTVEFQNAITVFFNSIKAKKKTPTPSNVPVPVKHKSIKEDMTELWVTSSMRFLLLEDLMRAKGYREVIHLEADNLLYLPITSVIQNFRANYHMLTSTPLSYTPPSDINYITASVLWVPSIKSLASFNKFLMNLLSSRTSPQDADASKTWLEYEIFLRKIFPSKKHRNGYKPFSVNEMSMMSYFYFQVKQFTLFPILPKHDGYIKHRYAIKASDFANGGIAVGQSLSTKVSRIPVILDSGSWGQYLGGTYIASGSNAGFTDPSHVIGNVIRFNSGSLQMQFVCTNQSYTDYNSNSISTSRSGLNSGGGGQNSGGGGQNSSGGGQNSGDRRCLTGPAVRFSSQDPWTLLLNLHVHSKQTEKYLSKTCAC